MSEEQRRAESTSGSITPRAVREFTPPGALRGYDRDTVDAFLKEVAQVYELAVQERYELKRRVQELESLLDESGTSWADETHDDTSVDVLRYELRKYREREHGVGAAILTAEKTAAELRVQAEKDVEVMRKGALEEIERMRSAAAEEAEKIIFQAHRDAKRIDEEASAERTAFEQELERLRSLRDTTRQDLSEFLSSALRGLEETGDRRREAEAGQPQSSPS